MLMLLAPHAEAAKILSVKNNKALIDLEGEASAVGNLFLARDGAGKKRAILEVSQVKQGRAIANLKKGTLQANFSLEKMEQAGGSSSSADSASGGSSGKSRGGVLVGYSMNSMTAKPASGSVSLSGSSFNLVGYYQMQLDSKIYARLLAGYETLNASGDQSGVNRTVEIGYLGITGQVEYQFYSGRSWDFFAGGGLGFLYAINKSSNILDTSKISINNTVVGVLGADYKLSRNTYIPMQLSYSMFPDNSSSSATQIIMRVGYGWDF
ncbi:hypothetical protein [Bdellovibrio sp. HCB2-146]|uniref:hypothetical protein n=1 Tax=Bdellovibrio sp. HCB2-146 TaxID=3394362 RepID=UPI0039BD659F